MAILIAGMTERYDKHDNKSHRDCESVVFNILMEKKEKECGVEQDLEQIPTEILLGSHARGMHSCTGYACNPELGLGLPFCSHLVLGTL